MITSFSQRMDSQPVSTYNFFYDQADQLVSAAVTNSGLLVGSYAYSYDPAGNRLTEQVGGVTSVASYNSLNQLSALSNSTLVPRTNEWDARHRLTAVQSGNQRTEFAYDGMGRLASIRQLQNGSEVTFRRFIWCLGRLCQERDSTGTVVTKRFFPQGVKFETGTNAGSYYYTRDHLGSVREMTDASGNLKARYSYDPFGRRTKVTGNVDSDFGFAGYIFSPETALTFPLHRVYDPEQGRWLSRDPLPQAETRQGPNLYAYVANEPVDNTDSSGLGFDTFSEYCVKFPTLCQQVVAGGGGGAAAYKVVEELETALPEVEIAAAPLECASSSTPTFPGLGVARDTIVDIVEEVAPEVAEAPEISELLAPGNGQTVQQLLLDAGEIGGTGGALGPNAQNVMQQFLDAESGYFAEFQEFMEVYSTENNPVPDILRFEDAFRLAHKLAVDFYGFDPYVWDRLSSL